MRRLPGQVGRGCARLLHGLATIALLVLILASVGTAALAIRLSEGPLPLPWVARWIENAANSDQTPERLRIGSGALAWEGFRMGVDRPLVILLTGVTATDAKGGRILDIPRAEVSLSLGELLLGRLRPRAIEIDQPSVHLIHKADGAFAIDLGNWGEALSSQSTPDETSSASETEDDTLSVAGLLKELIRPPNTDWSARRRTRFSQLRRILVRDGSVIVADHQIGAIWRVTAPAIDFVRERTGGVLGKAQAVLALGDQQSSVDLSATLNPHNAGTLLTFSVSPVTPAALARAAPGLAALDAVDAPVGAQGRIEFDSELGLQSAQLSGQMDEGKVRIGHSLIPVVKTTLAATASPRKLDLQALVVQAQGRPNGQISTITVRGSADRLDAGFRANLALELDRVAFADLPQLWPQDMAKHARDWIIKNIPEGTGRNAKISAKIEGPSNDPSKITLKEITGTLDGDGLTVYWLRPVPPIDRAQAQLHIIDPDNLEIIALGGRQRPEGRQGDTGNGGLAIRSGRMRITGLSQKDQFSTIEADIAGAVPDAIALLRDPRLQLLSKHPIDLRDPSGQANAKLEIKLPLEEKVQIEQIGIRAQAHLDNVHLTGIVAGRNLDQGSLDLDINNTGMKLGGSAALANIPTQLTGQMDFRGGPPSQVVQQFTVSGEATAQQLANAGLDARVVLSGSTRLQATLIERRSGQGQVDVAADLTTAELSAAPLGWRKRPGIPASAKARVRLNRDRLVGVDNIVIDGSDLTVRGSAEFADTGRTLRLDRIVLGRSEARGSVTFLAGNGPIVANLAGPTLDLSGRKSETPSGKPAERDEAPQPWTLDARFDRVIMSEGRAITVAVVRVEDDGRLVQRLQVQGRVTPRSTFEIAITPDRDGRRLTGSTADAGALLRAFNVNDNMVGGRLTVSGRYNDGRADHPLVATTEVTEFRIRHAPALAQLLKAMTLYGLFDVLQGEGLGFSRLVVPFSLSANRLELIDVRAFSPSLGLTAKGMIDLKRDYADIQGTIVPAYFFNSLLGNVPLIGRLFSPEKGGGVFAANYSVRGPLADPQVSVNPLSALTPGFLRGVFGIF